MLDSHIAYIAGFFDGEGCVHLTTHHGHPSVRISVGQKDPTTLFWMTEILGYGRVEVRKNGSHAWKIDRDEDKRHFIRTIFPHSQLKRRRLKLAYEILKCSNSQGKRMSTAQRQRRHKLASQW